jgi:hypothetical protein
MIEPGKTVEATDHESNLWRLFSQRLWAMVSKQYFEREATSIAVLGRHELTRRIKNFRGRFKLDFTEEYLRHLSLERLRHILLAAEMNTGRHN